MGLGIEIKLIEGISKMKKLKIFTIAFLGFCLIIFLGFIIPHHSSWFVEEDTNCEKRHLFVLSNDVHTDIGFYLRDIPVPIRMALGIENHGQLQDSTILGLGWGERIFYLDVGNWNDLTFSKAWKAMFDSPGTLIHASLYREQAADISLEICESKWLEIQTEILNSFQDSKENWLSKRIKGYSKFDWFYPATGDYSPVHTCNSWTSGVLRKIGLPTPYLSQFPQPLMWHLTE